VTAETGIPVIAVAGLDDLLAFAGESAELHDQRERLLAYRARYGRPAHRSDAPSGGTAR
jgi:orotate phosphoribosyltransferase